MKTASLWTFWIHSHCWIARMEISVSLSAVRWLSSQRPMIVSYVFWSRLCGVPFTFTFPRSISWFRSVGAETPLRLDLEIEFYTKISYFHIGFLKYAVNCTPKRGKMAHKMWCGNEQTNVKKARGAIGWQRLQSEETWTKYWMTNYWIQNVLLLGIQSESHSTTKSQALSLIFSQINGIISFEIVPNGNGVW